MKQCYKCKEKKLLEDFCLRKDSKDGRSGCCNECQKEMSRQFRENHPEKAKASKQQWYRNNRKYHLEWCKQYNKRNKERWIENNRRSHLKRKFNLTPEEYDRLLEAQGGVCVICRKPESQKRVNRLAVDHDHQTHRIRGLLCRSCNTALGKFNESVDCLRCAINYLESTRGD